MVDIILPRAVGPAGPGVPPGGTIGQVVGKIGAGDYDTAWVDQTGGGIAPPFAISDTTGLQDALDAKQPLDSDLTAIAALTTTSFGRNALTFVDGPAARTAYGVVIGTDVQAFDADLSALAALTGTNTIYYRSAANTWSAVTIGTNLAFAGGVLSATGGAGSGDVTGPASSTADAVAVYNGTTGKILKDGPLLASLAVLASPAFTGTPTAPTATAGTNTTQLSTTAFTTAAVLDAKPIQALGFALSDTTTAITTGVAKLTIRMPYAFTLLSGAAGVRASLSTASSSGIPTVDINEGGVSILSTKLTIDATEKTSTTAAVPAVISDTSLADDAEITFDIDVAGTGAVGLVVWLIGRRT